MASLNKVFLIGNLTRDPQVRYTPSGTAVADLGLAVNREFTTREGERQKETVFVDVVVWSRQAETCGQYLSKGRPVFVEGRLQLDEWEGREGEKRSKLRVVAERVQFLGARPTGEPAGEPAGTEPAAKRASEPREGADEPAPSDERAPADDDIPF